jgi:hypothetical protein
VRVHVVHHPDDADFVSSLPAVLSPHRIEPWPTPEGSDVALVLVSRSALREGLGDGPARALRAGIAALPVLLGADLVPLRFPVPAKHLAHVRDGPGVLRLLEDHRRLASRKIADGKRELFGYGLLLALLHRSS